MKSILKRRRNRRKAGGRLKISSKSDGVKGSGKKKNATDSARKGYKEFSKSEIQNKDKNNEIPDVGLNETFILKVDDSSNSDGDNGVIASKGGIGVTTSSNNGHINISYSLDQFVEVEYEFDPVSVSDDEAGTLKDDFSILLHEEVPIKDKQTMDHIPSSDQQNRIHLNKGQDDEDEDEDECDGDNKIMKKQEISALSTDDDKTIQRKDNNDHDEVSISHKKNLTKNMKKDKGTSSIYPNEILIQVESQKSTELTDDKSLISYDEITISPSISFFLTSNREELRKEGLSIAGNDHIDCVCEDLNLCNCSKGNRKTKKRNDDTTETDDTKTTKAYSVSSSKYTTDTAKLSELREKKRLMERHFERKYGVLPTMIEVSTPKSKTRC